MPFALYLLPLTFYFSLFTFYLFYPLPYACPAVPSEIYGSKGQSPFHQGTLNQELRTRNAQRVTLC